MSGFPQGLVTNLLNGQTLNQVQGDALSKAVIQRQKNNCHSELDSESIKNAGFSQKLIN